MCERRVLILALVTDIHDTAVTYPSCTRCYSKLLVDPTTDRYHCIRCAVSCDKRSVQWRYRLVLSIADGSTIGKVVVFGKTLDGFFGKTATDFSRSLSDLEQTGYPASSMLAEALINTFHGKYFYFGFKLSSSSESEERHSLKDVLKLENSFCHSQLDCTSNIENFHTLAYQMLACSDAVFASVTDHIRLFVKHLRSHNQSKPLQTPEQNQSVKNKSETHSFKNISIRNDNSSTPYNTYSFDEDLDSLRFSFETSGNKSSSLQETERSSRNKSAISFNPHTKSDGHKKNGSSTYQYLIETNDKETFLASETTAGDLPRCITFDTVNEDGESCFPSSANFGILCNNIESRIENNMTNGSFVPVSSFNHGTFHVSDIAIAQRLNFDDFNESIAANTSKKIDNELIRREKFTSQKSTVYKTSHTRSAFGLADLTNLKYNEPKLRNEIVNTKDVNLSKDIVENDLDNDDRITKNHCVDFSDKNFDVNEKGLVNRKMVDELLMPESEDLNASFESQFEEIEFTQDIDSNDRRRILHIEDHSITGVRGKADVGQMNSDEAYTENEKNPDNNLGEISVNKMCSKMGGNKEIPALEDYKDFLDSFEEVEEKKFASQSIVNMSAENLLVEEKNNDIENELDKEDERIENGFISDNQTDKQNFNDFTGYCKEVKITKKSSALLTGNNVLNVSNFDKDVNTGKIDENKLVERRKLSDNNSNDLDDSSQDNSDLHRFFADISNESNGDVVGSTNTKFQENSFAISKEMVKEDKTKNGKKTEDIESDLEEFFHDLSQLSLMGSRNNSVKYQEEINANVETRTEHIFECKPVTRLEKSGTVFSDISNDHSLGKDTSSSIINNSIELETRKLKISMFKPLCRVEPSSNATHKEHKSFDADADNQKVKTVKTDSSDIEVTKLETVFRSNCIQSSGKLSIDADEIDIEQENKKTRDSTKTSNDLDKCKNFRDESSCLNYSADLFEMSCEGHEQNSVCVFIVCTPSFDTKSQSEITSLGENILEDSPIGTSTPGLDKCVILDSQDLSYVCDSQKDIDSEDRVTGKRRVTFDKRLRRVSNCQVMDIRMRLNESPLATPVIPGKPCIKNKKKISLKNVPELSIVQEPSRKCKNIILDSDSIRNKGVTYMHIELDSIGNGNCSECLDGSADLFCGSFTKSKSPTDAEDKVKYYPEKLGTAYRENVTGQLEDVERVKEDVECIYKEERHRHLTEGFPNSQDLWLNESSDSFMYEAVSGEMLKNLETKILHNNTTGNKKNIHLQKHILEQTDTPDLFTSPCDNNRFPINARPDGNEIQYFSLKKSTDKNKAGKCSERMPLKCLVMNTPDCESLFVSKHKSMMLKCESHSKDNRECSATIDDMKENENVDISPDIFVDSSVEKVVCDRNIANLDKNNVLCKKLFF